MRWSKRARVVLPLEEGPDMPITRAWEVIVPPCMLVVYENTVLRMCWIWWWKAGDVGEQEIIILVG